jgi:hypothetical protein
MSRAVNHEIISAFLDVRFNYTLWYEAVSIAETYLGGRIEITWISRYFS